MDSDAALSSGSSPRQRADARADAPEVEALLILRRPLFLRVLLVAASLFCFAIVGFRFWHPHGSRGLGETVSTLLDFTFAGGYFCVGAYALTAAFRPRFHFDARGRSLHLYGGLGAAGMIGRRVLPYGGVERVEIRAPFRVTFHRTGKRPPVEIDPWMQLTDDAARRGFLAALRTHFHTVEIETPSAASA